MDSARHNPNRVKVLTPRGELGLFPHEYTRIPDITQFYEFIDTNIVN